ncbi:MAG: isocitrate lyase/phosphoenolpyruvate mutase family protein [Alphaproteobacteria bacterium]|nr:isocitrate lyase/phosphoenolpyruvate mutase family protein [Alphaproteobacteria bacterium]MCY4499596.1 isocitrate lyase/phosphoenolpyruvate mutase family protein [Rhodospirillaceae bacterium]
MSDTSVYKCFRALHERDGIFVIPNPWDAGTARILASMGFEALATTSAGLAFSLGVNDGAVPREQTLANCRDIVEATDLPVSADLEKGFGDSPESAAETVRAAAMAGLAGCSIEDFTNRNDRPLYEFALAVDRIEAAVEAARSLPHDFILTARCENFLRGNPDLSDTIARLQAFEQAGADALYAPALPDLETIRTVCTSVGRPVNALMGTPGATYSISELAEAGVRRVSIGSAASRVALGALMKAAREIREAGTFDLMTEGATFAELSEIFTAFE